MLNERKIGKNGIEIIAQSENGESLGHTVAGKINSNTTKIGWVCVRKEHRGMGIATQLLEQALRWAKDNGSEEVKASLIPIPGSEEATIKLVNKLGFEIRGNEASLNLEKE